VKGFTQQNLGTLLQTQCTARPLLLPLTQRHLLAPRSHGTLLAMPGSLHISNGHLNLNSGLNAAGQKQQQYKRGQNTA
jgi:hypothetical protein